MTPSPPEARPHFRKLRRANDEIRSLRAELRELQEALWGHHAWVGGRCTICGAEQAVSPEKNQ